MEFHLRCQCSQVLTVTEGSAGAEVACGCGRTVSVPPLRELRSQVGMPAYEPVPELLIETMLAQGQLPPERRCVECGKDTAEVVCVTTTCERAWSEADSGNSWVNVLASWLFIGILGAYVLRAFQDSSAARTFGRDKVYPLPLPICEHCRHVLRGSERIKDRLRRIPEYARLLDKFPQAEVAVS